MNIWFSILVLNLCFLYYLVYAKVLPESPETETEKPKVKKLEPEEIACIEELSFDATEKKIVTENDILPEDNARVELFASCYWKKKAWVNDNGDIEFDKFKASVVELVQEVWPEKSAEFQKLVFDEMWQLIGVCKDVKIPPGSSSGQKAIAISNCISRKLKQSD